MDPTDKSDSEVRGLERYAPGTFTKSLWVAAFSTPLLAGWAVFTGLGDGAELGFSERALLAVAVGGLLGWLVAVVLAAQYAHLIESKRHRVITHRVASVEDAPTFMAWLRAAPVGGWVGFAAVVAVGVWVGARL